MTDLVQAETPVDADVRPEDASSADAPPQKTGNEADPSPAVAKADDDVTDRVRSRFDELTKNWRTAERDRDHWRELALRNQQQPEPARPEPAVDTKPKTLADFEYDEGKYQAYLFAETEKRAVTAAERRLQQQAERDTAERRKATFVQREQEFSKDKPDYLEKTRDPRVPITPAMAEVMGESEDGPALAYYLANNLPIADQIARLPPLAAARELGRIEMKLAAEREKAKDAKKVSDAPPPAPRLEGSGDATPKPSPDSADSDKLSNEDWLAARNKQANRKRR
jgi:hypothetical protein